MCACVCAQVPKSPKEGVRSPGGGVVGGYEPLCGCWNLGHLQEQYMLLTAELSLYPSGALLGFPIVNRMDTVKIHWILYYLSVFIL